MNNFKKIIVCLAAAALMTPSTALAADVNIMIDGETFLPKNALGEAAEPFIEEGSVYLPVRAMGEAVGKNVEFDPESYAVYIGKKPSDEKLKSYPVSKVGDLIFYSNDALLFSDLSDDVCKSIYTVEKKAEDEFGKEKIAERIAEIKVRNGDTSELRSYFGLTEDNIDRFFYYQACAELIYESIEIDDESYDKYVTVRHILIDTREEAEEIYALLAEGKSFEELIEKYNCDPGQTKESSYTFTNGMMVEEFESASFLLKEGEITAEPVKSDYGFHIIQRLALDRDEASKLLAQELAERMSEELMAQMENAPEVTDLYVAGEIYGSIDAHTITKKAMTKLQPDLSYENTFKNVANIIAAYNYMNENGLISEEEAEAIAFGEDIDSKTDACMSFIRLANYKLANGIMDNDIFNWEIEMRTANMDISVFKNIRVFADGKQLIPTDVNGEFKAPKNIDGTVYVPVRAIVEALGMKADWDNETRTVIITK